MTTIDLDQCSMNHYHLYCINGSYKYPSPTVSSRIPPSQNSLLMPILESAIQENRRDVRRLCMRSCDTFHELIVDLHFPFIGPEKYMIYLAILALEANCIDYLVVALTVDSSDCLKLLITVPPDFCLNDN